MVSIKPTDKPPYLMIVILFIGAFVALLNNSLINMALPTIMTDFGIKDFSTVQWLTTIYMLVSGVLVPASAFLITKFTNRQLYITSIAIFTIGTLLAAISSSFEMLLVGRIVQAVGASVISPLLMNVMLVSFPPHKRGVAMGFYGMALIVAPSVGPTISGYIMEYYDWHIMFYMLLPVTVISLILAIFKLKNLLPNKEATLDYLSLVMSTVGFGSVLYGCSTAGSKGWSDPLVYGTIIIGMIGVIGFVIRQLRIDNPMIDMRIFKNPIYSLGFVIAVVIAVSLSSTMIFMPMYLMNVREIQPFDAGLMMLPSALVMGLMSPISGKLFDKFGARIIGLIGLAIVSVSTYLLSDLQLDSSYNYIISITTLRMFGLSMVLMPIMTNGLNQLPKDLYPHGTAMNNTQQQIAGAIGTAILVTIMNSQTKTRATELAAAAKEKAAQSGVIPSAEQIAQMKEHITHQALLHGINHSFLIAFGITILAFVLTIFLRRGQTPGNKKEETVAKNEESVVE
ncbi:DHA2 family efflux MFS transporter permease subunit [Bacillus thuringiensis]|uniref:MFS transporter n=1 Tax=Bacillus thuringiensis TaxID=1428 RepID=A0A9X6ZQY5_BACTU|nr:DHA2 family efflux MFS transporter permease subunit [Bacillus thuringiensis]PFJ33184.1 MFS transporter [Bacillus thuringiensis]